MCCLPATPSQTADVSLNVASDPKLNPYPNGSAGVSAARNWPSVTRTCSAHMRSIVGLVTRVTLWGVTDKNSWKNNWPVRGRTNYPLLFNRDAQPKPAFEAVIHEAPKKKS